MIKNYLKSAIHSLWRRKWFSLLTLVSIALALVMVIVITWFYTALNYAAPPESNKSRIFYLTAKVVDRKSGAAVRSHYARNGVYGGFYKKSLADLKTPETYTVFDSGSIFEFFRNNEKLKTENTYAGGNYFKVFDFDFVEGKPYSGYAASGDKVKCVITSDFAKYYFGTLNCIDQYLVCYDDTMIVSGVINKPYASPIFTSDLYIQRLNSSLEYTNWWDVAFLCPNADSQVSLKNELVKLSHRFSKNSKKYEIELQLTTSFDNYLSRYLNLPKKQEISLLIVLILIGVVLPVLCLVNILKNHQMHQMAVTGIHRVNGASRSQLMALLVIENVLLVISGGVFGLLISVVVPLLMGVEKIGEVYFEFFNWQALLAYLIMFVIIGIAAGVWPAMSMSNKSVLSSLKPEYHV